MDCESLCANSVPSVMIGPHISVPNAMNELAICSPLAVRWTTGYL